MVTRRVTKVLLDLARYYPIVSVTGPRQSGKSTACSQSFPSKPRISLEPIDAREYATADPRGFLAEYPDGAILDEVQRVPSLLSYLQEIVDADPTPGRWILTGSQNFALSAGIAQSLAGRTGVAQLLPLSLDEVRLFPKPPTTLWETIWTGGYPRIHDRGIPADRWLADYVTTYVQRDVRSAANIRDLVAFTTFLRLLAARTSQELNLSDLGADAGVSHTTARGWLSVLEASYLVHRLPPWIRNTRKQLVKAPKVHLVDSGLACWLLDIRTPEQLRHHPLRGPIFETWVVSEVLKSRLNAGLDGRLYHFRQTRGAEVDLLVERGIDDIIAVECKSGTTITGDQLKSLLAFEATPLGPSPVRLERRLIYGGEPSQVRSNAHNVSWADVASLPWSN